MFCVTRFLRPTPQESRARSLRPFTVNMQRTPSEAAPASTIALWGNFGAKNLGNECTLAATIYNLRQRVPGIRLVGICTDVADTSQRHGIDAYAIRAGRGSNATGRLPRPVRWMRHVWTEMKAWGRALRVMRSTDALVIAGTGIITDHDEGVFGFPYELFKWVVAARLRSSKVVFLSVGVEPIYSRISRFFFFTALKLAHYCSFRDELSLQRLRNVGYTGNNNRVYPDLAFSLAPNLLDTAANSPEIKRISVGVYSYKARGNAGGDDARAYRAYLDSTCAFILWLLDRQYDVQVIIGDGAYDDETRADVRQEIERRHPNVPKQRFSDDPAQSFEQVMQQLAASDVVVASRYHNVLLGMLLLKPTISLSYEAKNDALMAGMGFTHYRQSLDSWNLDLLLEQFTRLTQDAANVRTQLRLKAQECRTLLEEQYDTVAAIVRG